MTLKHLSHSFLEYHKKNVFLILVIYQVLKNPCMSIKTQLDTKRAKQIAENRNKIEPIIKVIILGI